MTPHPNFNAAHHLIGENVTELESSGVETRKAETMNEISCLSQVECWEGKEKLFN